MKATRKKKMADSHVDAILVCAIFSFLFLYYSVLLSTPYYADDIYNSCIRGVINEQGTNIWQYMWQQNNGWMHQGRIFPFAMIQYAVFYYVNNIYLYKLYLIIFTIVVIYLFGNIVYKLSDSCYLKNSAMLLAGVLIPVYSYDGVNVMNMYGGLVHIVLLFGFLAALYEICYFEQGRKHLIWMSAVFALCSMLTYETGWVFPIILCVYAFLYHKTDIRKVVSSCIPYMTICGGGAAFTFFWKSFFSGKSYDGIAVSFDIKSIWDTFCIQFFGAVPLANWGKAEKPAYLNTNPFYVFRHIDILSVIVVTGLIACVILNVRMSEKKKINKKTYAVCLCIGAILWAIPSMLVAISVKYQRELAVTQLPYLPYFMEIFGFCLLILPFFMSERKEAAIVLNLCLCIWIVMVLPFSRYAVRSSNEANKLTYQRPRKLLADATKDGLFDHVSENDLIVLDNRFVPSVSCNIFSTVDKRLKTDYYLYQSGRWVKRANKLKQNELECAEDGVYLVKTYITDTIEIVSASQIQKVELSKEKEITAIYTNRIRLYLRILDDAAVTTCSAVYYDGEEENAIGFDLKDYMSEETRVGGKSKQEYIITFEDHLFDYYRFIF